MKVSNIVGLIPISAKPFHRGHDKLIEIANTECETIILYISTSDRENVTGEAMKEMWENDLGIGMLRKVSTWFCDRSPVSVVYEMLGVWDKSPRVSNCTTQYRIYGDDSDIPRNFPEKSLDKYLGNLNRMGAIILRPISRTETMQISGTMMRKFLAEGDFKSFKRGVPPWLDAHHYWDVLKG